MSWIIKDTNGNPICNFTPKVLAQVELRVPDEPKPRFYVKFILIFEENHKSREVIEKISELENIDWLGMDTRCRLHPDITPAKAKRYLADRMREALPNAPIERQFLINKLGAQKIMNKPVFCTGKRLIEPDNTEENYIFRLEDFENNIYIDDKISEKKAATRMLDLLNLSPDAARVMLAHSLLYMMRLAYEEAWKSPCCCIFLFKDSGAMKTTFSNYLTRIYDRGKGLGASPRLNSSVAAITQILKEKRDCVVVLDDLCPSRSSKMREEQEQTLLEITRMIGDGVGAGRVKGKKTTIVHPECGVVFTGEYVIGTGSDAARLLPVEMSPPDTVKFKEFQDEPLLVSTFYEFYIRWFINNYDKILDYLKEWRGLYSSVSFGVHSRLQETHFFLNTAFSLFLQFLYDKDFITKMDAEELHKSFRVLLNSLVEMQQKRVTAGLPDVTHEVNYLMNIRSLYKSGKLNLSETAKEFEVTDDGFIHKDCLYLYSSIFNNKICKGFLGASRDKVLESLVAQGALKTIGDRKAVQISGTGGKRFIAIFLEKLV